MQGQQDAQTPGYQPFPGQNDLDGRQFAAGRPGPGKRLLGLLVDSILFGIVLSIIAWLLFGQELSRFFNATMNASSNGVAPEEPTGALLATGLIGLVLWMAYRAIMEVTQGGSVGKKVIGARVTMADGSPITYGASLVRNSWYVISSVVGMIPGIGSLLNLIVMIAVGVTIGRSPEKQSFSDKWAKAIVVDK